MTIDTYTPIARLSFKEVAELKVGDRFIETDRHLPGVMLECEVVEAPTLTNSQLRWKGKLVDKVGHGIPVGEVIDYLLTEGFTHYGPTISVRAKLN